MARHGDANVLRARRVARTLNHIIGMLHACRFSIKMWTKYANDPAVERAFKFSIQMAEGVAFLNMRKLRDLYKFHLKEIMPETSLGLQRCEALIKECEKRNVFQVANLMIAHYAENKCDLPLPQEQITELIGSNGWSSHEEVSEWLEPITADLFSFRDELMQKYQITTFDEEEAI